MDYKRVLRLHYVNGFNSRAISESTKDGKTKINEFLKRFRESEETQRRSGMLRQVGWNPATSYDWIYR